MADAKILKCGLVDVSLGVEFDRHLVDNALVARLLDVAADGAGLSALHVVFGENIAHALHARINHGLVIGCAALLQQVLEHAARNSDVTAYELHKVLARHNNQGRRHRASYPDRPCYRFTFRYFCLLLISLSGMVRPIRARLRAGSR